MKELAAAIQNLTYVTIDRAAAKEHWVKMAKAMDSHHAEAQRNRELFLIYKATAGLLSHRSNRNFRIHTMREKIIRRYAIKGEKTEP